MTDLLGSFGDAGTPTHGTARAQTELDILVIVQGRILIGVQASSVDSVVQWQRPEPLPQSSPHVMGVIQDRGRLVAVHRHAEMSEPPQRLIVCTTAKGLVGVPATETRHVGGVTFDGVVQHGVPVRTSAGDLTLIDVEELARQMTESERSEG